MSPSRALALCLLSPFITSVVSGCTSDEPSAERLTEDLRAYAQAHGADTAWPHLPDDAKVTDLTLLGGDEFGYRMTFSIGADGGSEWQQLCVGLTGQAASEACGRSEGTDSDPMEPQPDGEVLYLLDSGTADQWNPQFTSQTGTVVDAAKRSDAFVLTQG